MELKIVVSPGFYVTLVCPNKDRGMFPPIEAHGHA